MSLVWRPMHNPRRMPLDWLKAQAGGTEAAPTWLCQPKWDGWRRQAWKDGGRWRWYPKGDAEQESREVPRGVKDELEGMFAGQDGIAIDMEWVGPRCHDGLRAMGRPGWDGLVLLDLVYVNGLWLGRVPCHQRLANLRTMAALARGRAPAPRVEVVQTAYSGFEGFFEECKRENPVLEGVVMKRADSLLLPGDLDGRGQTHFWKKVKWRNDHEPAAF